MESVFHHFRGTPVRPLERTNDNFPKIDWDDLAAWSKVNNLFAYQAALSAHAHEIGLTFEKTVHLIAKGHLRPLGWNAESEYVEVLAKIFPIYNDQP